MRAIIGALWMYGFAQLPQFPNAPGRFVDVLLFEVFQFVDVKAFFLASCRKENERNFKRFAAGWIQTESWQIVQITLTNHGEVSDRIS